jgi:hypothetical protein
MSNILGARVGSGDPAVAAALRAREPAIVAVGARRQAPRNGAEFNDHGYLEGRDPRTMSQDELRSMGHEPMSPTQAIRAHCLDCCAGSPSEVAKCMALRCPSWPFRTGKNPWRAPMSEERREALRQRSPFSSSPHKTEAPIAEPVEDDE